jgi:mRNA interferase MazF
MNEVKRGDIYYIVNNYQEEGSEQRAGRPAVVVSNDKGNQHSNVIEVVYLTTQPKTDLPTHIDIKSANRPSIALCEQISSVSKERLGNYIGSCTKYELDMLAAGMMISLGIDFPTPKVVQPQEKKEEKKAAETVLPVKQAVTYDEFIKVQTERDTFVRLYRELLEKLIGGKAAV